MAWILPFVLLGSCDKELVEYEKGSVEIVVERGDAWLHDFPLFLGIKRKNPPQIAVWIEDAQGRYLSTVYASSKIATQSWLAAGGNRRLTALPRTALQSISYRRRRRAFNFFALYVFYL